jgi:SET domain-containing protein
VFIHALTAIAPGQELFIDYGLSVDGALTDDIRTQYMCHCGASACRRTMLGNNAELP